MTLAGSGTDAHPPAWRGYLSIVIAVAFWGGSAALAKLLFNTRFDPLIITQTRTSLSFLLLAAYFLVVDRSVFRIQAADLQALVTVGIVGVAFTNYTYYFTVKESSVATAILIQYTAPVLVTLYAAFISKEETFTPVKLLSLALALAGCFVAVSGGSAENIRLSGWSALTGPASAVFFAFQLIASKRVLRRHSIWTMLLYAFGSAGAFWMFINPPWLILQKGYSAEDWGILWLFAVVSILIPHTLLISSLKILEASRVSITTTLEPFVAMLMAWIIVGEPITWAQAAGGAGVIGAVLLLQVRRRGNAVFADGGLHAE